MGNEPQTVERLEVRDLLLRAFSALMLIVVALLAVVAM